MVSSRARERHGLLCMESNCLLGFCQCAAGTLCQIRSMLYFFCQFRCQVETSLKPFCRQRGLVGSKSSCRFTAAAPLYGLLPSFRSRSQRCLLGVAKQGDRHSASGADRQLCSAQPLAARRVRAAPTWSCQIGCSHEQKFVSLRRSTRTFQRKALGAFGPAVLRHGSTQFGGENAYYFAHSRKFEIPEAGRSRRGRAQMCVPCSTAAPLEPRTPRSSPAQELVAPSASKIGNLHFLRTRHRWFPGAAPGLPLPTPVQAPPPSLTPFSVPASGRRRRVDQGGGEDPLDQGWRLPLACAF